VVVEAIKKYWLEGVGWILTAGYLSYILVYYSWGAFLINVLTGVIGFMAVYYFGELMPFIGYFMQPKRKPENDDDAGGKPPDQANR
jgi:hypothetical protein